MKRSLHTALMLFGLTLFPSAFAQAGVIEFFFPSLKTVEPDPGLTLEAPFADKKPHAGKEGPFAAQPLPENAIPLDQPHRNINQISDWVVSVAAEALTFDETPPQAQFDKLRTRFTANGWDNYNTFITTLNLPKVLESKKYTIRSYVTNPPLLINKGASGGAYQWLYEVPLMVSYLEPGTKNYKTAPKPINQKIILTLQVGRSATAQDKTGLAVGIWNGKVENPPK